MSQNQKIDWKQVIENVPDTCAGQRGVSAAISAVHDYRVRHDLVWTARDTLTVHVVADLPHCERIRAYHSGSRGNAAYYTYDTLTPKPLLEAAMQFAATNGIKYHEGLIYSTVKRGVRQEWSHNGKRWTKVRRWVKRDGKWIAPSTLERYYTARSVLSLVNKDGWNTYIVTSLRGKKAQIPAYCVTREKVAKNVAFILSRRRVKSSPSEASILRAMRRLSPSGWEVVTTPSSEGATPSPAFREHATGEEYHVGVERAPRAKAAAAFAQRASVRESAVIAALVERGEADGVYVCLADSLRAGNCRAGSESYAARHNLDASRHYPAGDLRSIANGDAKFVRAAIIAAFRRHSREMRQGFALLSDHSA